MADRHLTAPSPTGAAGRAPQPLQQRASRDARPAETDPLERLNGEIKRHTSVVGIFPNDVAARRLVTVVIVETHDEWAVAERRYLSEESMAKLHRSDTTPVEEAPLSITA